MANKAMYNVKSAMSGDPRYNSKLLTEIQNEISKYAKNLKISGIDVLSYTYDGNGTYSYKFRVNTKSVDSSYQNGLSNLKGQATLDSNGNLVSSVKISSDGATSYNSSRSKSKKYLDPNIKSYDKTAHITYGNDYDAYRDGRKIKHSELYHHGILGQKWGIRRFQNEDGSLTPAGKERYYTDKDEYGRDLSDEDLRRAVSRMQQERQFKQLNEEIYATPAERKAKAKEERKKKIKDAAVDAAISSGKAIMTSLLTNGLNYAIGVGTGSVEGSAENFGKYLYYGKGQFKPSEKLKLENISASKVLNPDTKSNPTAAKTVKDIKSKGSDSIKNTTNTYSSVKIKSITGIKSGVSPKTEMTNRSASDKKYTDTFDYVSGKTDWYVDRNGKYASVLDKHGNTSYINLDVLKRYGNIKLKR